MQILKPEQYYLLLAFYIVGQQAQKEAREHEKMISALLKDNRAIEEVSNMIYDPSSKGNKKELDEVLDKNGIMIEWKPAQNKFAKEKDDQ
jgi:hypothetical protein